MARMFEEGPFRKIADPNAIYASKEFIEAGGLIAYGPSYPDLYRRAAASVDKVLKGEKPARAGCSKSESEGIRLSVEY
jgi:ABC-type uncharacterized transport system substrate-binding protein